MEINIVTQKLSMFKLSPLSKVLIPLLSGTILIGCNNELSSVEGSPSVPNNPTEPKPVEIPPAVDVPSDEGSPSETEVFLSYIDSATTTQAVAAMSSDTWLLKCADDSTISPSISDDFGPMWTLSDSQSASCGAMTIVKNGSDLVTGISVDTSDLGKGFFVDTSGQKTEVLARMPHGK